MAVSPMMQQYLDAKALAPDALLLFRMGDFYELFHEDAKTASKVLGLTLTTRDKNENPVPMAGFPYHQLDGYLAKLIAAGHRAAVCEQVENPKQAKGLVKRELTRVVTAGTVTDDSLLDPQASNYLAAVTGGDEHGIAWMELSTGRFFAMRCAAGKLADELARIAPVEVLCSESDDIVQPSDGMLVTKRPAWAFGQQHAAETLSKHFGTHGLDGFGFDAEDGEAIGAAGALLHYLTETQRSRLDHIDRLIPYRAGERLEIDEATRRSLEIAKSLRHGQREGSLIAVLDRSSTPMGSRLWADWVNNPLTNVDAINERLDAVQELVRDGRATGELHETLKNIYDIERLLGRVTTGRATPRDLGHLGRTLALLPAIKARLTDRSSALLQRTEADIDLCPEVRGELEKALEDDCPLTSRDGGFIRAGFSTELDGLRELATGGKQWIAKYQAAEAERTGISNLKVGFNKVFGYYLEITQSHRDKTPDTYIRKQTVKNAERYVTQELKEYEEKVLTADEKAKELEAELFAGLRDLVAAHIRRLRTTAQALAQLDVIGGLARLARERNYCRPTMTNDLCLRVVDGRHPVLDALFADGTFVPNDIIAGGESGTTLLITGPNMAGKSTYIRQVALITLLAQAGSFVPAREAEIGVVDRIFARVGANDEIARGQSTFMVEMTEAARILNTATERSLVVLDEIGRGTSTYDGLSLAWAIVEFLHDKTKCRTFFATHYHELTDLAKSLSGVRNLNVAVREWQESIIFLHKIIEGPADKSYGIHVARLAGVPKDVLSRAKQVLSQLEQDHLDEHDRPKLVKRAKGEMQMTLFAAQPHPVVQEIRQADINSMTPLDALALIKRWQDAAKEG